MRRADKYSRGRRKEELPAKQKGEKMKRTRLENRFDYEETKGVEFDKNTDRGRSKTAQSFSKEANINTIIAKYKKTGMLTDPLTNATRQPYYGDFTNGNDYFDMTVKMQKIKDDFQKIPGQIRAKFNNDIGTMLDFINNKDNLKECVQLGLLPKELLPPAEPLEKPENKPTNTPPTPLGA